MITLPFGLLAEELTLNDKNILENFEAQIIKKKFDLYDPDALSTWALSHYYPQKYQKVQNDEFEFDDAKVWALDNFKKKLEMIAPIAEDTQFHTNLRVTFGEYDFKTKRFPLEALTKNSYLSFSGKGEFVSSYNNSTVTFTNADNEANYLEMEKDKAKAFIASRKNRYGSIDRELIAHYIYTINKYEEDRQFQPNSDAMLKFTANLISVEFMESKTNEVLKKYEYKAPQGVESEGNTTL